MRRILLAVLLVAACGLLLMGQAWAADGKVHVLWMGQAAIRITSPSGKVIVIDPFLIKNPKTPAKYKDLKNVGHVDIILLTHAHGDHIADAPALSEMNNATVWGPAGLIDSFNTLGIIPMERSKRMNKSGTIHPFKDANIAFTQVHAEHSSELKWKDPDTGKLRVFSGGEPIGWIVKLENGFTIYHMGDTGVFGDMGLIAQLYHPDLILIPIGGHYVMSPEDAAFATNTFLKPKHALPIHYGTIPVLKGTPAEYIKALGHTSTKVHAINPGDELVF